MELLFILIIGGVGGVIYLSKFKNNSKVKESKEAEEQKIREMLANETETDKKYRESLFELTEKSISNNVIKKFRSHTICRIV